MAHKGSFVFAQVVTFLNDNKFRRITDKFQGNRYVKHFTCWNQLLVLMFGQLSNRVSMRDLIVSLKAHHTKWIRLGVGKSITLSNLAKANEERDYHIFEEFAFYMIEQARSRRINHIFQLEGNVYAFDSTTISLCLSLFPWAKFRSKKGGVKVHVLFDVETSVPAFMLITCAKPHDRKAMIAIVYEPKSYYVFDRAYNCYKELYRITLSQAFFVVRAKTNMKYKVVKWKRRLPKNILSDCLIQLADPNKFAQYPETIRMVKYWDEETQREFVFLSNAKHLTAQQIADLYKSRWQVELFFKWMKGHLRIKRFWGTSVNAVRIQVYVAIITYCLVAIIQHDMKLDCSIYEILQILNISLTDTTPLVDLFCKSNFQDDKDQMALNEPLLFNDF